MCTASPQVGPPESIPSSHPLAFSETSRAVRSRRESVGGLEHHIHTGGWCAYVRVEAEDRSHSRLPDGWDFRPDFHCRTSETTRFLSPISQ
jgi:hypothetical protein